MEDYCITSANWKMFLFQSLIFHFNAHRYFVFFLWIFTWFAPNSKQSIEFCLFLHNYQFYTRNHFETLFQVWLNSWIFVSINLVEHERVEHEHEICCEKLFIFHESLYYIEVDCNCIEKIFVWVAMAI